MAENLTLARPYAEAAFQLAKGANSLPAWSASLANLAAVTAYEQMVESIGNPFALDDNTLKTLVADLERKFGCRIQVSVKVDAALIGGVRIAVGDEVIDASVRGKLAAMATALKN